MAPTLPTNLPISRLRRLLPKELLATVLSDPTPAHLAHMLEYLRTLQHLLRQYLPRQVVEAPPAPGEVRFGWQHGTLMFTDLAGFTSLLEAHLPDGQAGAEALLEILNNYFTAMLEIISTSGGYLLEFTGDALLAAFTGNERTNETLPAVRAGLRAQRAMARFDYLHTEKRDLSLHMRVGLHAGRYLATDLGTPYRMEHVLLGQTMAEAKAAEAAAWTGRVCLSDTAAGRVQDEFRLEPGRPGHALVVDDLTTEKLGDYDVAPSGRRRPAAVLLDWSADGLAAEIERSLTTMEPLAAFLPRAILGLIIESAAQRKIPPAFVEPTILFVNLLGLPQSVDRARPDELTGLVAALSTLFDQINNVVETHGGVLKKVTCHHIGSDIVIYFGAPHPIAGSARRAAETALAIRALVQGFAGPIVGGQAAPTTCQVGMARGWALAAEIGESRGRREFNVLGDVANTAAHLMNNAAPGQILLTESVYQKISREAKCVPLPPMWLKGKSAPVAVYALQGQ